MEDEVLLDGLERMAEVMQDAQEENDYLEVRISGEDGREAG
ncbi:MAG: hypothetical protein ACLTMW_02730 [Blautia hydrogenotrophica]